MSRTERFVAIVIGVVLGITIVILFVFLGSSGTIDAPSLHHGAANVSPHVHTSTKSSTLPGP